MRHGSREERRNLFYPNVFRFVWQRLKLMSVTMDQMVTPQSSKRNLLLLCFVNFSALARDCLKVSDFVREAGIQCLNM